MLSGGRAHHRSQTVAQNATHLIGIALVALSGEDLKQWQGKDLLLMRTIEGREGMSAELFTLEPDSRIEDLRNWITYQWAFKCWYVFWPTESQIVTIAGWFKVLCETVIDECDAEFIRRCDKQEMIDA